jgi:nucleotide-binding universal stress UspA family protein
MLKAAASQKKIAQQKLKEIKTQLETKDLKVKALLKKGNPSRVIVDTAEQEDVNLIVIGSHGKGLLKSAIMGSVSEDVLRNTDRPILMIKNRNT